MWKTCAPRVQKLLRTGQQNLFPRARRTIRAAAACARGLRVSLRLIGTRRWIRSTPLLTPSDHTRERSSLRRNHWWARVPDRGDAHQQPVARAAAAWAGHAHRYDAFLRPDAR